METTTQAVPVNQEKNNLKTSHKTLYVVYGSRTGNSKAAATLAWEYAGYLGMESELLDMKTFPFERMEEIKNLLIAVSTHGEGDPPAVVEDFYRFMHSEEAPLLEGVKFSILALGDSSYNDFCKTGWDFRERLLELGAQEVSPLVECDIDYEENAKSWVAESVTTFERILPKKKSVDKAEFAFELNKRELDQNNAFYAKVLKKKLLTSEDYEKRTLHLTLSMENFGPSFFPGDSFGIYTSNSRFMVDKLLKALQFDGTHAVLTEGTPRLLKEALVHDYEITMVTPVVLKKYAEITGIKELSDLLTSEKWVNNFCENHDVLDLVTLFPGEISPEAFLSCLRKLGARLYSVASSPLVFPNELHLTASMIEYPLNDRQHRGVCSTYIEDRVEEGDSVPVFHEPNEKFRLPEDDSLPIIMIGAGTGIAPFRGFLQEREHRGATGKNWLVFGDRHSKSDFLYGKEMTYYQESGLLSKLDLAFSRDTKPKKYVQHCLLENRSEFFRWIDQLNAVVYLCGNKRTMGKDAKETIRNIVAEEGRLTEEQADDYIQEMIKNKKLLMDLY